jgi:RHS repeat-associated protein
MSTSGSWTREYNSNSYHYNQGSESNTNTGWYETLFRDYDPVLGRFVQIDPLAAKYDNWSPYHYAFNDPVFWNDPSGAGGDEKKKTSNERRDSDAREISMYFASIDAFANAMYGIYSPIYNEMTYGSPSGVGGSAFARYGPGDRGALLGFVAPIFKRLAGIQGMMRILNAAINRSETFSSTEYYWDWSMGSNVSMTDRKPWAMPCLGCLPEFESLYEALVEAKSQSRASNRNSILLKVSGKFILLPQHGPASYDRRGKLTGPSFVNEGFEFTIGIPWRIHSNYAEARYLGFWTRIESMVVGLSDWALGEIAGTGIVYSTYRTQLDRAMTGYANDVGGSVYLVYPIPGYIHYFVVTPNGKSPAIRIPN